MSSVCVLRTTYSEQLARKYGVAKPMSFAQTATKTTTMTPAGKTA